MSAPLQTAPAGGPELLPVPSARHAIGGGTVQVVCALIASILSHQNVEGEHEVNVSMELALCLMIALEHPLVCTGGSFLRHNSTAQNGRLAQVNKY